MSIRVQSPHDLDGYFDSPEDCPTKWLLMLRAYIDESGHEAKNWMFLAGYYGSCDHWEQFVRRVGGTRLSISQPPSRPPFITIEP